MKRLDIGKAVAVLAICLIQSAPVLSQSETRFIAVDVYIESQHPVAAWQIEFSTANDNVQIVGVENGDSDVFGEAPYYDRQALANGSANRVIVADYSLHPKGELPQGQFRITTLHLIVRGDAEPTFDTQLVVASNYEGARIRAAIRTQISTRRTQ